MASVFEECLGDDTGCEMTASFLDCGFASEEFLSARGRAGRESRSDLEGKGDEWGDVAAELEAEADCRVRWVSVAELRPLRFRGAM